MVVILCLCVVMTTRAQDQLESRQPVGHLTVSESLLECPEVKIELPTLAPDEKIESLWLLRSTTDLKKVRSNQRYPMARLPIQLGQRAYMDTLAPQDVLLYYQLEIRTSSGQRYWSNVQSVYLESPPVPPLTHPSIRIDKRTCSLLLLDGNKVVRRFPIALGANSTVRKLHEDRASTPEGIYRVSKLEPRATYHRAISIDYPNTIDRNRYDFFASQGLLSYPKPEIGKEVQIHGDGIASNWTWGSIAMRDEDIDWLFDREELSQGLEVRIVGNDLRPEDLSLKDSLTSEEREEVDAALTKLGYLPSIYSEADWYHAINRFQMEKGLTITGTLDQVTRARILKAANGDFG